MFLGDQIYQMTPVPYLAEIHYMEYCRLLTAARLNTLDSTVLWGRYKGVPYTQRTCHCTMGVVESTEHILLTCPLYVELRQNLIAPLLRQFSFLSRERQVLYLLNNVTRNTASQVAKFLFLAFKRRKILIDCIDMGLSV